MPKLTTRYYFLLLMSLLAWNTQAQDSKLLSEQELNAKAWFYDVEEALAAPEKVYNLSITWEDLEAFPDSIVKLTHLQNLDLMDNKIREIPPQIAQLKYLQILSLSNNKITKIPEELKALKYLKTIHLERNRIKELPEWLKEMPSLQKIGLRENVITKEEIKTIQEQFPDIDLTH